MVRNGFGKPGPSLLQERLCRAPTGNKCPVVRQTLQRTAACQRRRTVRVVVVNLTKRQERVHRSVSERRHIIHPKGTTWVIARHLIFGLSTAEIFRGHEAVKMQRGESGPLNAPQITATALYPPDVNFAPSHSVLLLHL